MLASKQKKKNKNKKESTQGRYEEKAKEILETGEKCAITVIQMLVLFVVPVSSNIR